MNLAKWFFARITDLGSLPVMAGFAIFFLLTNFSIFLPFFFGIVFSFSIISIIRMSYYRMRPYKKKKPKKFLNNILSSSFPSSHSSNATIFALVVGSFTSITLLVFFCFGALMVIVSRWVLEKHHFSDIFAGTILGALISIVVLMVF